ncbi:MAG: CDP-alcohol phosphatidyltransferase family protein [Rhodospirillaceae bacterium]|jgi:phosphatidylglycerophosphate synthase|nr:CDP-alcohol phosphatidyltransferase family protein [Rhodospirillaceae bacterium]MBT5242085.1 CDP-alcohol phosphatidyltransferase family protein [Rhodospirillaceae bacterium]MBT5565811.1 CDP-alcohol phosphatidyltransferase family protein [Rhodospirillaceae bacterium]MBT6090296.1 CDP-alcohol phosphatidyltransferase family protein [Rhodospirillaceae bacterium]MBT6960353.1 CDP-alcohol phosphatidyltransferase family protein [Rhodospirillaceae bacterium]
MFDPLMVRLIGPPINWAGRNLAQRGISANSVTVVGFLIGLGALPALAFNAPTLALVLVLLNRVADGLDGAIARATEKTDFGAYLDIVLDFIFYAAIALGFAFLDHDNAIVVAVLVTSFIGTGASFLAFAVIAAKRGLDTQARGNKSFFYSGGLAEGTETIVFFVLVCAQPDWFIPAATIFIAMCWITVAMRINQARVAFGANATS